MPAILRLGGLRVTLYLNDHPPPHAHVIGGGGEAVLLLNGRYGPVELRECYWFNGSPIRMMAAELLAHIPVLCSEWGTIHGNP